VAGRGRREAHGAGFHGERRTDETHGPTADPEARLHRKSRGKEAKLRFMGHVATENRNGVVVFSRTTLATGAAERNAGLAMVGEVVPPGSTLGGDKGYDTQDFVEDLRDWGVTPHVAQNDTRRRSAIDGRTTHHEGYAISQKKRKPVFRWMKTVALLRKTRHRGVDRVGWLFTLSAVAYDLVRIRNLTWVT
jgi:IS5 family transposase